MSEPPRPSLGTGLTALEQMRPATLIPASTPTPDDAPPPTQRLPTVLLEALDEPVPETVRMLPLLEPAAGSR